jgi:hypothetical protein
LRGKSKAFLCIIIVAVLAIIPHRIVDGTESIEESIYIVQTVLDDSYTKHEPIVIHNNSDFSDQGWPGSGTFDDPYVIEGFNITDNATGISIRNTTVYFEIRNCIVSSSKSPSQKPTFRSSMEPTHSISKKSFVESVFDRSNAVT